MDVFALNVNHVVDAVDHQVPVRVSVPDPIVIVRVFVLLEESIVIEWFRLLKSTVPLV